MYRLASVKPRYNHGRVLPPPASARRVANGALLRQQGRPLPTAPIHRRVGSCTNTILLYTWFSAPIRAHRVCCYPCCGTFFQSRPPLLLVQAGTVTSHACWIWKIMLIMLGRLSTRFSWYVATCSQPRPRCPLTSGPCGCHDNSWRRRDRNTNESERASADSKLSSLNWMLSSVRKSANLRRWQRTCR